MDHKPGTASRKPLLHSLRDGSAGVVTRLLVSLAGGLLLLAVASVTTYMLGYLFPPYYARNSRSFSEVRVSEEVAAVTYLCAGLPYLALLFWIWSHQRRSRPIWLGVVMTVGIGLFALALCGLIEVVFRGDDEFLITAVMSAAGGLILLGWIRLYRRYAGGRALFDENGVLDLRCPACQYRMVGLKQSRCPECGQEYTLDELVGKQDFEVLRLRRVFVEPREKSVELETEPVGRGVPAPAGAAASSQGQSGSAAPG